MGLKENIRGWFSKPPATKSIPPFSGIGGGIPFGADNAISGYWSSGRMILTQFQNENPPGAKHDYVRDAGDLWRNSAVAIGLRWIKNNFHSARLQVCEVEEGEPDVPISDHPMIRLLRLPNPDYTARDLWSGALLDFVVFGNAYWIKHRGSGGNGAPLQLYYEPAFNVTPNYPLDGSQFISEYIVNRDGRYYVVQKKDIVHFRDGIDPKSTRLGLSTLKSIIRSICTLNSAESFSAAITRNMGVSPYMLVPLTEDVRIDESDALEIKKRIKQQTSGENAGEPSVPSLPVKPIPLGLSPEDMALDKLISWPEASICAALGVSPMVLGLNVGDSMRSYANLKEADSQSWNNSLIPIQETMAAALHLQLLPDFETELDRLCLTWDRTRVPALQEDQKVVSEKAAKLYQSRVITFNEARAMVNLPPRSGGDDQFYSPAKDPQNGPDPKSSEDSATPDSSSQESDVAPDPDSVEASQVEGDTNG